MPAIGNTFPTLLDLSTRMEKGSASKSIIELLAERNDVLDDIPWLECNDGSSHKTTVRTGIPEGTWRKLNYGVAQEKSTTAQIKDSCGMLESYSTIDSSLLNLAKDKAGFRMSEERPFIEGLQQSFINTMLYGDTTVNPERFTGLAARFSSLTGAENSENVINASGATSCTSIWLVVFGEQSVHGLYPSGSQAGLQQKDLGEQTVYDGAGNPYQAHRTHFKWDCGITVRDWRQAVRVANVNVDALVKDAQSGADLVDLMVQAMEKVHDLGAGRPAFLVNRTISSFLRRQMTNRSNALLNMEEVFGRKVMTAAGIPIRRMDALLNTETAVA